MKWSEVKAGMLIDQLGLVIDPNEDVSESDRIFLAEKGKQWARIFDWNDCSHGSSSMSIDLDGEYEVVPDDITGPILIAMRSDMERRIEDINADLKEFDQL